VNLNSVTFRGATAVSDAELRDAYAEFLGKSQPVSVICAIRDRAARIVFDRGILARVEIPEQRIAGGALVLEVIEAHVVNVRVRGDVGPAQAVIERYAEKLRGMSRSTWPRPSATCCWPPTFRRAHPRRRPPSTSAERARRHRPDGAHRLDASPTSRTPGPSRSAAGPARAWPVLRLHRPGDDTG
jgi:hypothetical protein